MQLPANSLIVVADGKRMLFFRNSGDAEFPNLAIERVREQDNPPDREQGSDQAGRAFTNAGGGTSGAMSAGAHAHRSAYEETDFHQLEEDRFAADTAEILKKRALANDFDALVVVAPPKTMGELRKHYHKEVERRLAGEVTKDLTGHPVAEIEKILASA